MSVGSGILPLSLFSARGSPRGTSTTGRDSVPVPHDQDISGIPISERASVCRCFDVSKDHYHCPCDNCRGRPVSRRTAFRHAHPEKLAPKPRRTTQSNRQEPEHALSSSEEEIEFTEETIEPAEAEDGNDLESGDREAVDFSDDIDSHEESNEFGKRWSKVHEEILDALFELLELKNSRNLSVGCFDAILQWGKKLYSKNNPDTQAIFPETWTECQKLLNDLGFEECKEYFICLSDEHRNHYSVMQSPDAFCKYCNQPGSINYYYLGLRNRVVQWSSNRDKCRKMTSHWEKKSHWIMEDSQINWGINLKEELWDGVRFAELSYFWDPNKEWVLPVRCPTVACGTILSSADCLESPDADMEGIKRMTCPNCYACFNHKPTTVRGDPRNIAYIGHWDGWQPFQSPSHGCGAIEVSIATMCKRDRNHTSEVYVVGFVPTYKLPKRSSISLDPFLEPFVQEIENGFIEGIEVEYALPLQGFPSGPVTLRHMLLLWTGDHVAQCEVSKGIFCGKHGCRFCHLVGERSGHTTRYVYSNCLESAWKPHPSRHVEELIEPLSDLDQEERQSIKQTLAKDLGFKGTSILHRLYPLYGFDFTKDFVIDLQHGLPLNPVKHEFEALLNLMESTENSDVANEEDTGSRHVSQDISEQLDCIPWTSELAASRTPKCLNRMGFWKAEDWQKYAYPASEFILYDKLPDKAFSLWQCLCRMVELVFGDGRNGWTENMAKTFHKLALRHNILVEDVLGKEECRITVHNLIHVNECVHRFGCPDNYWCWVFERAVSGYVNTPTNKRNIECTYATKELQKEFLMMKRSSKQKEQLQEVCKTKMWAKTLEGAVQLVNSGLQYALVGALNKTSIDNTCLEALSQLFCQIPVDHWTTADVYTCRSVYKPVQKSKDDHVLYKAGDAALVEMADRDIAIEIRRIFLLIVKMEPVQVIEVDTYRKVALQQKVNADLVENYECSVFIVPSSIKRKLMLLPARERLPGCQKYLVIDYLRPFIVSDHRQVIVPYLPTENDMVLVQGTDSVPWQGRINGYDRAHNIVSVVFYVEDRNERGVWVRESRRTDRVHVDCIVGVARGNWIGHSFLAWRSAEE